jgi:pectinesterase
MPRRPRTRALSPAAWAASILLLCTLAAAQTIPPDITPDITVAADGSGDFESVNAAVASIPRDSRRRTVIFIKDGVYREKVRIDAACVTLRGQSRAGTRIEFAQLNDDFTKKPDAIGRAVVNLNASDCVLENLTIANTAGVVGPHAFAVYGGKCDRTVIVDCDVFSDGADTVSLWQGADGRYYHARCNFRGAVDFVCPRGWCYIADSTFYETKKTAALWHDGAKNKEMKFVLRNCKFDGVEGWNLARHHHDAQFFLLDCTFAKSMTDRAPFRVIYPLSTSAPTDADRKRNAELDKSNLWGERAFYQNCHRDGGDYAWHQDNLTSAPDAPGVDAITPAWTFGGTWDPLRTTGPKIVKITRDADKLLVQFDEPVTVKGQPRLLLSDGSAAALMSGGESDTLRFAAPNDPALTAQSLELAGGAIVASQASAATRRADLSLPR